MADHNRNQEENVMEAKESMKSIMYREAKERMELLGISANDVDRFFQDQEITKIVADHKNMRVGKQALTTEEQEMIRQLEEEMEILVYYLIQDEGLWPDGCSFPRYTLLHVNQYQDEYGYTKECMQRCGAVPAYVINQEEPECSEITEFGFRNISGLIINVT